MAWLAKNLSRQTRLTEIIHKKPKQLKLTKPNKPWFRSPFMPSSQEMDWTYSKTALGPHGDCLQMTKISRGNHLHYLYHFPQRQLTTHNWDTQPVPAALAWLIHLRHCVLWTVPQVAGPRLSSSADAP